MRTWFTGGGLRGAVLVLAHAALCVAGLAGRAQAQASIVMASTTSTEQSGLFTLLLPEFTKARGMDIKVVALGTGQALDMARRGDADVLFAGSNAGPINTKSLTITG